MKQAQVGAVALDPNAMGREGAGSATTDAAAATHEATQSPAATEPRRAGIYLCAAFAGLAMLLCGVVLANRALTPEWYSPAFHAEIAETFVDGKDFAVFDLNVDSRGIRREHIHRLPEAPELMVLGASHWQEAPASLAPGVSYYNAHIHRDYYEDLLAMVGVLIDADRLPETLVISIRDYTFNPVEDRTDYLWHSFLPDYRDMAARLGLPSHHWSAVMPTQQWKDLLSLKGLWTNLVRWTTAKQLPGPITAEKLDTLDILRADGSIHWSRKHQAMFTQERARAESLAAAAARSNVPPRIDPEADHAFNRLLQLLRERGVEVVLVHPPFNPYFYRLIQGTPYMEGLRELAAATERMAEAHGARVAGGFDATKFGCTEDMYIDAEHSSPDCLAGVFADILGR